jgi:hypothetical protein
MKIEDEKMKIELFQTHTPPTWATTNNNEQCHTQSTAQ